MTKEKNSKVTSLAKKEISGFRDFIAKGNVIDLAVGVIIGSAFGNIVSSIVNDILMPLIGIVIGGIDFTSLSFTVKDATINYGMFIQNVIDFLIIALCVYAFVCLINKVTKKEEKEALKKANEKKEKPADILLLEEIRDLLKK